MRRLLAILLVASVCAGCVSSECKTDQNCPGAQVCVQNGSVLFGGSTCVSVPSAGDATFTDVGSDSDSATSDATADADLDDARNTPECSDDEQLAGDACVDRDECEDGSHTCNPLEACVNEAPGFRCEPPRMGRVGDACNSDADCAGDDGVCLSEAVTSVPDGFCSEECDEDDDCPEGSACGMSEWCEPICEGAADCRSTGFECSDRDADDVFTCRASVPGAGAAGAACAGAWECDWSPAAVCVGAWRDGYCAAACESDADCAAGEHCAWTNGDLPVGICMPGCESSDDCREDYYCADRDRTGGDECTTPSTRGWGRSCDNQWECEGREKGRCDDAGICVIRCDANNDCPAGKACQDDFGGACTQFCDDTDDACPSGWSCPGPRSYCRWDG